MYLVVLPFVLLKEYAGCGDRFSEDPINSDVYSEINSNVGHVKAATSIESDLISETRKGKDTTGYKIMIIRNYIVECTTRLSTFPFLRHQLRMNNLLIVASLVAIFVRFIEVSQPKVCYYISKSAESGKVVFSVYC